MSPPNDTKKTVKVVMHIRHHPDVKKFVDDKAAELNILPGTLYRNIFNAGLETQYNVKIHNNQITEPNSPVKISRNRRQNDRRTNSATSC